jgi:CRP/FNR family transcriptional regulator, cyclic AMP receptor protein
MPLTDPAQLREIPLFNLLDDEEVSLLAQQLDEKRYLAGQLVFSAGEEGGAMYIVQTGRVELYIQDKADERVSLGVVEPGSMFGEFSLLDNEPRSATAKAVENTQLLIVDRNDLQLLIKSHPDAALDMLAMLTRRIREANYRVQERVLRNVNDEIPTASTLGERLSDLLTAIAGDIRFVYFSVIFFTVWIVLNANIIPGLPAFDPNPYGLLTMIVSLEAIFLSLFVLISQNRQTARDKVRNDIEYEVNLRAEVEIRGIQKQVDDLQELMLRHLSAMNSTFQAQQLQARGNERTTLPGGEPRNVAE